MIVTAVSFIPLLMRSHWVWYSRLFSDQSTKPAVSWDNDGECLLCGDIQLIHGEVWVRCLFCLHSSHEVCTGGAEYCLAQLWQWIKIYKFMLVMQEIQDSKIAEAQIWPTYCMEWWHLDSPLLFATSGLQANLSNAVCQQQQTKLTRSGPNLGYSSFLFWPTSSLHNA